MIIFSIEWPDCKRSMRSFLTWMRVAERIVEDNLYLENASPFLSFPFVCPEPVLVI
jgi:hypothetical protein|eukprot:COSAG06_NODE_5606_length_3366_cov_5.365473_4_plen_56_part_00